MISNAQAGDRVRVRTENGYVPATIQQPFGSVGFDWSRRFLVQFDGESDWVVVADYEMERVSV